MPCSSNPTICRRGSERYCITTKSLTNVSNVNKSSDYTYIGKPRKSIEGGRKVTGCEPYTSDLVIAGMHHARPVLSPYAHAGIRAVDKSEALTVPGVTHVLTAADLPTRDAVIKSRSTCTLAGDRVVFTGQPVAVVIARSAEAAEAGAELVHIEYDVQPVAANFMTASGPDAPEIWPDGLPGDQSIADGHATVDETAATKEIEKPKNVHHIHRHERGDVEKALATADVVVRRNYRTARVHQGYLEPMVSTAVPDPVSGGITIYLPCQTPVWTRAAIAELLRLEKRQVHLVNMTVGGGFGSKNGILDPLVAACALAVGRPVSMVLTRTEDFLTTTPSAGGDWDIEIGADKSGAITALRADIRSDAGAFASGLGSLLALLVGSYYKFPNLLVEVAEINTNTPHCGPYRAPGAPQTIFALESTIDDLAHELQIDPLEFRLQNCVETGDLTVSDSPWQSVGLKACLERLREHPAWRDRNCAADEGVGIALAIWPGGACPSSTVCRVSGDGVVTVHIGSPDISGTHSGLVLVAAETLTVSPDQVEIVTGDSDTNPHSVDAAGSMVTYSVTGAVLAAATGVKTKLLEAAAEKLEAHVDDLLLENGAVHVNGVPDRRFTIAELAAEAETNGGGPGPIMANGQAAVPINAPAAAVQMVKVHVDRETGEVTPLHMVAVQDVGTALNPLMIEGQMHGGAVQGLGFALHERMVYDDDGQLISASFLDYDLPKAHQVPTIEAVIVETPSPEGALGVRGVGEPPIIPGAAAVGNAIRDATGVRINELPMRPEVVWRAIEKAHGAHS